MPAALPPSSGYTYAAEFSVDEAVAAGATDVRFSQPLPVYVENFLGFPVGGAVPTGYYDRQRGQWIASANGRVIKVLSITDGLAEPGYRRQRRGRRCRRARCAGRHDRGTGSAWRCSIRLARRCGACPSATSRRGTATGLTARRDDAEPPPGDDGDNDIKQDEPNVECGSVIGCENQTLGKSLPIAGTPWQLHYQSDRTPGRQDDNTLVIPVSGATIPASLVAMRVEVSIAGRTLSRALCTRSQSHLHGHLGWQRWLRPDAAGRAASGDPGAF